MMLLSKQKSKVLINALMNKRSENGHLNFDPFNGSYSTASLCLLVPGHRRCIIVDKDKDWEAHFMGKLVESFP